jgi:hypothetical protein
MDHLNRQHNLPYLIFGHIPMTAKDSTQRSFWSKNIGPADRMIWALVGLILMSIGFEPFKALDYTQTGIGLVFVFVGFLIFLQAPFAWSLLNAVKGRSTFERDVEKE